MTNLNRLWIKLVALVQRLFRALIWLPKKLTRLFKHLLKGVKNLLGKGPKKIAGWWQDFALSIADVLAFPELAESLFDFVKWNTRPLSPLERSLAKSVFGEALHLDAIRLDNKAVIGCKKRNIVYVSFFTINAWGKIREEVFIHEMVHVWQYQKMGAAYVTMALRAQKTDEGYNYGGVEALKEAKQNGKRFLDFNLEQQADIIADYYCIREGRRPAWGKADGHDLPIYKYFLEQLIDNRTTLF